MVLKKSETKFPRRGEVYWIDLEPTRGGETKKTRPGLIISNDIGNEFSNVVMVAPITSKVKRVYPTEVKTLIAGKSAKIMLHQCRAVDKSTRILDKIYDVDSKTMANAEKAIAIVFGLS
ncbi:MAG: Endoribonuclease EndoA [Chlamydiales bacterium]|nr:Endoribonuclease EndoA [Chlamydiales bacterium]